MDAGPQADVQNPYRSFVVTASAGSGKTYQLSQRYLRLVAAGADPTEILTVTFTRKAAAEMKERIFADAIQVLADHETARELDEQMQNFFRDAMQNFAHLRKPRPAIEAAEAILALSQSLKIQTIDSLVREWIQQFPVEAGEHIPIPFEIASSIQITRMHHEAFQQLFEWAEKDGKLAKLLKEYLAHEDYSITDLRAQMQKLYHERTFIWELKKRKNLAWEDFLLKSQPQFENFSEQEIRKSLANLLQKIVRQANSKEGPEILAAAETILTTGDLAGLRGVIFTKNENWTFKKTGVARKVDEDDKNLILNLIYEARRGEINGQAQIIYHIFDYYEQLIRTWKHREHLVDFDDLSMGAFNLFYDEESFGARYYLFLRASHLLVDEFQDTSNLQWDIYWAIAEELLSGQGLAAERGITPTVFFVGDAKQSIYSFRQANYRLLQVAAKQLQSHFEVETVSLGQSWRSSQFILDRINDLFSSPEYRRHLPDFQDHRTAELNGQPVVPNFGSFTLLQPLADSVPSVKERRREEARRIVQIIRYWLDKPLPIYDKSRGEFRPITYRDIGILYRDKVQSEQLEEIFIQNGLPYRREEKKGYYERREIQDLIAFLKFLAQPTDNVALATLLRSPLLGLTDADLMQILADLQKNQTSMPPLLFDLLEKFQPDLHKLLRVSLQHLGRWSLDNIVLDFLERTKAFAAYRLAWGKDEGQLAEANLKQLIQMLALEKPNGAGTILDYLELVKQSLSADETGNAPLASNCITLMTMHKAKGLEFPVIILIGAETPLIKKSNKQESGFRKSHTGRQPFVFVGKKKIDRPPEMGPYRSMLGELREEEINESMRLLYVALTRAREHVLVSPTKDSGSDIYAKVVQMGVFRDQIHKPAEVFPGISGYQYENVVSNFRARKETVDSKAATVISIPDFSPIPESGIRIVRPSEAADEDAYSAQPGLDDALAVAASAHSTLAEREKARILGVLVHKGLEAKIHGSRWDLRENLQLELLNSLYRFKEEEAEEIRQAVLAHLDRSWTSQEFQTLLTRATEPVRTELPVLHLKGKALVHGVIDLLIPIKTTYWIIDFKSIPTRTTPLAELIKTHQYDKQLRHYARAVLGIFAPEKVCTAVLFTQIGQLYEI